MEKLSKTAEVLTLCSDDEQLKALTEANKLLEQARNRLRGAVPACTNGLVFVP